MELSLAKAIERALREYRIDEPVFLELTAQPRFQQ